MKQLFLVLISLCSIGNLSFSQNGNLQIVETINDDGDTLRMVHKMPKFQGDISKYLAKNIRYPADATEMNIQGQVVAEFVVGKDGSVGNIIIKKSVFPSLDAEVVRVIKAMPKWQPGEQDGKKVPVFYTLPVRFSLQNDDQDGLVDFFNTSLAGNPSHPVIFPYGEKGFIQFLVDNYRHIPDFNYSQGEVEAVVFTAAVNTKGELSAIELVDGIYDEVNAEALRLLKKFPALYPKKIDGKAVASIETFFIPILSKNQLEEIAEQFNIKFKNNNEIPSVGSVTPSDRAFDANEKVYKSIQKMPTFPGDLNTYIAENIHYPIVASELGIEGTVVLEFVIRSNGNIDNIVVKKQLGGGCTEEAIRLVKEMPKWNPGEMNGKKVACYYTIPIKFSLSE